jgi:hypothetical protein
MRVNARANPTPLQTPESTDTASERGAASAGAPAGTAPWTLRYGPATVTARYPKPFAGTLSWERTSSGWTAEIALPAIGPEWIIVPSFSTIGHADYGFRFTLSGEFGTVPLTPIRAAPESDQAASAESPVTSHLDCWHTPARGFDSARVRLDVFCSAMPQQYLVAVSARPLVSGADVGRQTADAIAVPAFSQMTAAADLRRRICSPTCVAMVLSGYGRRIDTAAAAAACLDPVTHMYGMWPLAIHTASAHGVLGTLETFTSLDDVTPLLRCRWPIIASIDFGAGELDGSPQPQTNGHLVVVRGIDTGHVVVNDPAADDDASVPRRYDRAQFTAAWLNRRGVGYVLLSP